MSGQFAFFDIDGTLITESIWDYFLRQPEIAPQKRGAYARFLPMFVLRKIGIVSEPAFREGWVKQMARLMRGWTRAQVDELFDRIVFDEFGAERFRPDVAARVAQHLQQGDRVILVSGMFSGFAERFARLLGAEAGLGTQLAFKSGACAGEIDGRGCAGVHKPAFMREYARTDDLSAAHGYADSYSDVPMLSAVGQPVATYPDAELRPLAVERGWQVIG